MRSLSGWCQRRGQEGSGQVTGPSWKENVTAPSRLPGGTNEDCEHRMVSPEDLSAGKLSVTASGRRAARRRYS